MHRSVEAAFALSVFATTTKQLNFDEARTVWIIYMHAYPLQKKLIAMKVQWKLINFVHNLNDQYYNGLCLVSCIYKYVNNQHFLPCCSLQCTGNVKAFILLLCAATWNNCKKYVIRWFLQQRCVPHFFYGCFVSSMWYLLKYVSYSTELTDA